MNAPLTVAPASADAMPAGLAPANPADPVTSVTHATYPIRLHINGQPHDFAVEAWVTLLDLLRERAGLTGAKKGCDHGQCGACTVLVGGRRINACLTLAVMQNGKQITTVEGLADGAALHPLQQAFIDHDAFQCGYCTSGQLCSAVGLMQEGQAGTVAEVRELMSGNVCRCGAYPGIVAAVTEVMGLEERRDDPARPYLPGTVPA